MEFHGAGRARRPARRIVAMTLEEATMEILAIVVLGYRCDVGL